MPVYGILVFWYGFWRRFVVSVSWHKMFQFALVERSSLRATDLTKFVSSSLLRTWLELFINLDHVVEVDFDAVQSCWLLLIRAETLGFAVEKASGKIAHQSSHTTTKQCCTRATHSNAGMYCCVRSVYTACLTTHGRNYRCKVGRTRVWDVGGVGCPLPTGEGSGRRRLCPS